jgi:hypothetical protein
MAYAVFPGDERYHVVKAGEDYTLCGLPALTPDEGKGEHHPLALVTEKPPTASLLPTPPFNPDAPILDGPQERGRNARKAAVRRSVRHNIRNRNLSPGTARKRMARRGRHKQ